MRVAFLLGHFPLLSEAFILTQIAGLLDQGHEVDIYALDGQPLEATAVHPVVEQYRLLDRTYYSPHIPKNFGSRVLLALSALYHNRSHLSLSALPLVNGFKYGREATSLRLFLKSVPFFSGASYDIIHCQFGTYGLLGQILRDIGLLRGKLITTFRGYDISAFVQENGDRVYDNLFQKGDYFLVNCEFFKRRLMSLGCPSDRTQVHFSGIDCDRFAFSPRYISPEGKIQIVTTGRLVEKKGIEYCICAIARVATHYPNLEYTIIGDGPLRSSLEMLISELNLENIVRLVGWKRQDEIAEILRQSHIFMAPSLTSTDGNQDAPVNTLKEAMAVGLPVISTIHGGIPELVQDGVSGFLVPERDAEAIASRLEFLIQNPDSWAAMGTAGRKHVEEQFDMHKLNHELVNVYQRLINSAPPNQPISTQIYSQKPVSC